MHRKVVEYYKNGSTGHPSRSWEDRNTELILRLSSRGFGEEQYQQLAREYSDILAKKVVAFCPCPKNLPMTKLKNNELISLVEAISRQPKINSS